MIYVTSSTSSASVKYYLVQVKSYRKHKKGSWNHVIDYNLQSKIKTGVDRSVLYV